MGGVRAAVADALMPYLPSLFAFGMSEQSAAEFLAALRHAGEREGAGWLDWFVAKVAGYATETAVHDLESAAAYLRAERDLTLRLLRDAGLTVSVRPIG